MENRAYALSVGIFTLVLGVAVAFAFWWFSGRTEQTYDVLLYTDGSVSGLNEQAAVRFRGMRAGRVTDINFDPKSPRRILVRVRLASDVPLSRGTTAKLATQGLTGFIFVQMDDDGSDTRPIDRLYDGVPLIGLTSAPSSIADSAINAMERVREVADRLAKVLNDDNRKNLSAVLGNIEESSRHLEAAMARLPALIDKADGIAARLDTDKLDRTLNNLERGTASLPETMATLRSTLSSLGALSERLESVGSDVQTRLIGEGGPKLSNTLSDLQRLSSDLGTLIDVLERNPQSLIFGRKPPVPGPGEAGFVPKTDR